MSENHFFDNRLLDARKRKGWTQKETAAAADIHPASYSAYETDQKIPPAHILKRIADALEVSMDFLCGRSEYQSDAYETYGNIARTIYALKAAISDTVDMQFVIDTTIQNAVDLNICFSENNALLSFFQKAEKYRLMADESEEAAEMYRAWLEDQLRQLDKSAINYAPF